MNAKAYRVACEQNRETETRLRAETSGIMQALAAVVDDAVPCACEADDPSTVSKIEKLRAQLPEKRPLVLYVDDERANRAALALAIEVAGFDVVAVPSAEAALAELERRDVSIVVSDQRMPGMTGSELLRLVKARWPRIRRVLFSAYAEEREKAASEGATFVNKGDILGLEAALARRREQRA